MLAGPGSIATVMLLMGRAEHVMEKATVLMAIAFTGTLAFFILLGGTWAERHLGKTGLHVLNRVMGLLLAAIAVQFVVDGIVDTMGI